MTEPTRDATSGSVVGAKHSGTPADEVFVKDAELEPVPAIRPIILLTAMVAFVLLSALVWHTRGPAGWERPIISTLRPERLPISRPFLLLWEPLPFAIVTGWLGWTALKSHRVQLAIFGTVGCATAVIFAEHVLKPLVGRHSTRLGAPVFPSGHVTAASAWAMFAWLIVHQHERIRSLLIVIPVAMSWAVVSEGLHFPADAIAGSIVGALVVYGVVAGLSRLTAASLDPVPAQRNAAVGAFYK